MRIRIVGTDLPRAAAREHGVFLGAQRGAEVTDPVSADAASVVLDLEVTVVPGPDGSDGLDFRGPFVHGRRGERFLYLVWSRPGADGRPERFGRTKLQLAPVAQLLASRALPVDGSLDEGLLVTGSLGLTDARGGPVFASVRPPAIQWELSTSPA